MTKKDTCIYTQNVPKTPIWHGLVRMGRKAIPLVKVYEGINAYLYFHWSIFKWAHKLDTVIDDPVSGILFVVAGAVALSRPFFDHLAPL